MRFNKIYNLGFNDLTITYYPCAEEQPLSYDYELREEDEFYQFEKQYKISIKQMVKEIEKIIMKPIPNQRTRVEILFILCFDLSNLTSFDKLLIYFNQIERHFKLAENDYKMILLGNKVDKRVSMKKDETNNLIKKQMNLIKKNLNKKDYSTIDSINKSNKNKSKFKKLKFNFTNKNQKSKSISINKKMRSLLKEEQQRKRKRKK